MIGETLTVSRGHTDARGNRVTTGTHTIAGVLAWGTWSRNPNQRAESAKGDAQLYAAKGTDLRQRDRVSRGSGQTFAVVAGPHYDGLHPLTRHDFGVAVYQLEAVTG